jgi:hypothetical protein
VLCFGEKWRPANGAKLLISLACDGDGGPGRIPAGALAPYLPATLATVTKISAIRAQPTLLHNISLSSVRAGTGTVIFINGFRARATVGEYVHHLLNLRPGLHGRVQQFSCRDDPKDIARHVMEADGPVTLIGNSLGAASAAEVAIQSRCVRTLFTLAPVGSLRIDFGALATSVSAWINLKTPAGIADAVALSLSQGNIGPWGYGPEPYATRFIDSPLGHAEFWPQMDAVAAAGFEV